MILAPGLFVGKASVDFHAVNHETRVFGCFVHWATRSYSLLAGHLQGEQPRPGPMPATYLGLANFR